MLLAASAPASLGGGDAVNGPDNKNSASPQLLYMRRLHDRIKGTKIERDVEIKDEQTSGRLIATSFEAAGDITGTGECP